MSDERSLIKAANDLLRAVTTIGKHLDVPYADDPRWTPWTRFVETPWTRLAREISAAEHRLRAGAGPTESEPGA